MIGDEIKERLSQAEIQKKGLGISVSKETTYKTGFWFIFIFLIGFLVGMWYAEKRIIIPKLMEAKRIGALVIGEDVYDLKERK
jgi:hypothetical protein